MASISFGGIDTGVADQGDGDPQAQEIELVVEHSGGGDSQSLFLVEIGGVDRGVRALRGDRHCREPQRVARTRSCLVYLPLRAVLEDQIPTAPPAAIAPALPVPSRRPDNAR